MFLGEDGSLTLNEGEKFDASVMRVNTEHDKILDNIRTNVKWQLPQLQAWPEQIDQKVVLVGGSWSLNAPDVYEELRELYFNGAKLVALNGSVKWLMERNLRPSIHVILDARPDNIAFLETIPPHCHLFLASQCDPTLFMKAIIDQGRDPYIFHGLSGESVKENEVLDAHYGSGGWFRLPACGTVGVTSILLCRVLGFRFQHLFGMDSCYRSDGVHHAYPQALNDKEGSALFQVGKDGRVFRCSAWQAAQARSFLDMLSVNAGALELSIHGDGLLAYLLQVAADHASLMEIPNGGTSV